MVRVAVSLLWILVVAVCPTAAMAQERGLAVTPLLLETLPGVVRIQNGEAVAARLKVSLQDFEQAADGSNRFLPLGTGPSSCGARAHLASVPDVLPAGATVAVAVDVTPGPLCWGVLMVEASRDARPGNRVAVKFYHIPPGSTRDAEITGLTSGEGQGQRFLRMVVRSRGTAPVRPFGRVEFRNDAGVVVAAADVRDFGLHPSAERFVMVPVPQALPAGRYVVLAVLDVGAADFVAAQAVLEFGPAR